ncbi:MAG TPA: SDR family NAD(P)-dependent oxidoreductase [Steroidobacteraceae bacterium]|nr:SDR family NAD(P)-dependent oxidoreductase [Steroidobacteraceae bacterium]
MSIVVVIAGATGALGQAVTRSFLEDGAVVVALYRDQARFDALASSIDGPTGRLEGHRIDVTDIGSTRALIDEAVGRLSGIDALINTVGGYAGGAPVWELDRASLDQMLSLNLFSLHSLCRAVIPHMLRVGRGAIVNVSSKAAVAPPQGASAYAASKAAGLALMQSLAADLRGTGVRANSVVPNIIDTEANRRASPKADPARWTQPAAIARVVRFLCGDDGKAVRGAAIAV